MGLPLPAELVEGPLRSFLEHTVELGGRRMSRFEAYTTLARHCNGNWHAILPAIKAPRVLDVASEAAPGPLLLENPADDPAQLRIPFPHNPGEPS